MSAGLRSVTVRALEPDSRTVAIQIDRHKLLIDAAGSEAIADLFDL